MEPMHVDSIMVNGRRRERDVTAARADARFSGTVPQELLSMDWAARLADAPHERMLELLRAVLDADRSPVVSGCTACRDGDLPCRFDTAPSPEDLRIRVIGGEDGSWTGTLYRSHGRHDVTVPLPACVRYPATRSCGDLPPLGSAGVMALTRHDAETLEPIAEVSMTRLGLQANRARCVTAPGSVIDAATWARMTQRCVLVVELRWADESAGDHLDDFVDEVTGCLDATAEIVVLRGGQAFVHSPVRKPFQVTRIEG